MSLERTQSLSLLDAPELDRPIRGARGEHLPIRAERPILLGDIRMYLKRVERSSPVPRATARWSRPQIPQRAPGHPG